MQTATIKITETDPNDVEFHVSFDPPLNNPQDIAKSNAGRLADIAVGVIDRLLKANPEQAQRIARSFGSTLTRVAQSVAAAEQMDWQQVVLNGGPPCFHLDEDGSFCGRAQRWDGHEDMHGFVSLADLLRAAAV